MGMDVEPQRPPSRAAAMMEKELLSNSGPAQLTTSVLSVEGMTCGACTAAVERALRPIGGVVDFKISLLAERAAVVHDSSLSAEKLAAEIEDAGFDAAVISSEPQLESGDETSSTVRINVYGLLEPHTSAHLERMLGDTQGVVSAKVDLNKQVVMVTLLKRLVTVRTVVAVIESMGFDAILADTEHANAQLQSLARTAETRQWKNAFVLSLLSAIPVLALDTLIPWLLPQAWDFGRLPVIPGLLLRDLINGILSATALFGVGRRFYISACKSIRHGSPTMDVLVVLGTSAAFLFSCLAIVVAIIFAPHKPPKTIFDASTMLITFITLGRWIESRAKGQTSTALSKLMSLAPSTAAIYDDPVYVEKLASQYAADTPPSHASEYPRLSVPSRSDDPTERSIPSELIEAGDVVILRPGDKVPADGVVIFGESWINESMVTGEAEPTLKKRGSELLAGTVNGCGHIDLRITRAGKDTRLSQIVDLVHQAQTNRAPIQRLADQVAGHFVPIIIVLSLSTFAVWTTIMYTLAPQELPAMFTEDIKQSGGKLMVALTFAISVVVFACPCALGLATPTAIMVSTGVASRHGILIKGGGAALEAANKVTHVILDKTGSLTHGELTVADTSIESAWLARKDIWWTLVSIAESRSEHPIGQAIALYMKESSPSGAHLASFQASPGRGIQAEVAIRSLGGETRHSVLAGNAAHLASMNVDAPEGASPPRHTSCMTLVHIGIDGEYAGTLGLSDTIKPTARAAITALHMMGISTSLVTGDNSAAASLVAREVGIPSCSVLANVTPEGKRCEVARLQADGHAVAMVGDGINDSPALAAADLGIGLVSGSDVAAEAADIVLMAPDDLLNIAAAISLSRTSFGKIKANLCWACGYNLIGLPFAMGLFVPWGLMMPPALAGAAMALSSISVTLNSLTLRWWNRPAWLEVAKLEANHAIIDVPLPDRALRSGLQARGFGRKIVEETRTALHYLTGRLSGIDEKRGAYATVTTASNV